MTANCPACKHRLTCPSHYQHEQQEKPVPSKKNQAATGKHPGVAFMTKILIPLGSITSDPRGTLRFMECDTGHNATTHANSVVWYPDGRMHNQNGGWTK